MDQGFPIFSRFLMVAFFLSACLFTAAIYTELEEEAYQSRLSAHLDDLRQASR